MDRKRASAVDTRPAATNKDPFTYATEKERFLKDLRQFHDGRGTTIPRWPYIGGKTVDLYALYTAVTQLGGWEKVSNDETWGDIQDQFCIPVSCSNADHALRQIYIRYLNAYEKLHHFGQDPDSREDTTDLDDLPSSRKKTVGPVGGVAVTYNYQQHNIHESTREILGLPKEVRPSEYANLERSLMSGLPNEIDFAVNICLLLSTEGKHSLKGSKGLRIVELLLSHVGICKESELALIWLISESKLNFLRFWNESVDDQSVKELVCPECLLIDKVEEYRLENGIVEDSVNMLSVLNLGRGLGMEDREAQRVIQLAVITRNLSFEEENLEPFASSLMVLRFIMLCAYNKHGCIRQLALDTMANVAIKMNLEPVDCGMTLLVLKTVSSCLLSWDKFQVVSALETLSRLCQMELNEEAICCQLDDAIYEHLIRLLTIQDLQLIVSALETIYQLSEIGTVTSNRIAQVSASVDVLVALLTLEAEAYGPSALLGISAAENTVEISTPVQGQTMGPPPARLPSVVPRPPAVPCVTPNLSITQMSPSFLPPRAPLLASTAPASVAPSPLPAAVQCSPGPGIVDSEAAACNWLQAQYELSANCSVKKMDMYRKYVSTFGMYGLQNLVSPTCFANCIRVAFPGVDQESTDKGGTNEVVYKGLTSRQKPGSFSPATGDFPSGQQTITNMSTGDAMGLSKTSRGLPLAASTQMSISGTNSSQLVASFPAIQQVLLSNQGRPDLSSDSHSALASRPIATGSCEPNFVKTLLASKVTQHMNRLQNQQVVDTLDASILPTAQQNGTTLPNSLSGVNVSTCDNPDGAAAVACSDSVKLMTTTAGDSRTNNDIVATTQQNSFNRTLESSIPTASEVNKSVLNEHSYIQTAEVFHGRSEFCASTSGQMTATVVFANRAVSDGGKLGEVVDGLANWDGNCSRGLDSADTTVCARLNSFEENISAGGDLNSLELACDSASSFQEFNEVSMPLPIVMNGGLSLCKNQEKCMNDAENVRSVSSVSNSVAENTNGKECGSLMNGVVRGIVNGECATEKSHLDGEHLEGLARKSSSKKDDDEVVNDHLGFQKQCTKAMSFANRLAAAEDTADVLVKNEESNAKDLEKSNKLLLQDIVSRSENGSRVSDGTDLCYQAASALSDDRYQDPECSYDMSSEELSPFPSTLSNVDGVSDSVSQAEDVSCGSVQQVDNENDRKINTDPNRLLLGQNQVDLDPSRNESELDLNTDCPFGEGMSATTENSDILLLEDFTVAHEEVLISEAMQDQSAMLTEEMDYSLNPSDSQSSVSESESGPSTSSAKITQAAMTSSVLQLQRPQVVGASQEMAFHSSLKDVQPSLPNSSLSVPISIPACIQARLASFQLNSFPTGIQSRLPLNAFRPAGSQLPVSASIANPNQPSNPHSVPFFPQTYPANDTGQHVQPDPPTASGLQTSMQIPTSHTAPSSQAAHQLGFGASSSQQPNVDSQVASLPAGISVAVNLLTETSTPVATNASSQLAQTPNQALVNHPQGMSHAVHPLLPQNSPLFVTPSSSAPASQGPRIQFLSSSTINSSPGHPPQLHKFVSTTTPGHIIIQRAQLVPQQQQQQQQSLRPLQQPIFQRFFVSQSGGMPQRQIVIQSNPMLLQQGAGQLRPGFVQQTGQPSSVAGQQPLVMQSTGQMLPPQQRHVVQAGQLTGYRLIQQGVIGQQGQGLGQRPLLMQQGGQQGQVLVQQQQGQVVVQQGQHAGLQDLKTGPMATGSGQTFAHQGQSLDQQMSHSQGQMLGQGQAGQITAQQGQVGQVVTQQGQAGQMVAQQGQVIVQQGQAGQIITQQGQTGQMLTQQGQTGQVIMQQGHMITQQGQVGQVITHPGQLGQMITPQGQVGHIFTQQGQLLVGQQGQILCHTGQQGPMANQGSGPLVIQHSGGQIVLQGASGGLQNCIMFQQGVKRMVDPSKDPAATSSLNLPTSAASYRIITANAPLHSGNSAMTNIQQPLQQLQVSTGSQVSQPVAPPASPSAISSGSASKKRKTATSHSRSAKKRKKDDEDSVGGDVDSAQGKAQPVQYVCEWIGCQGCFGSFSSILQHATKEHFEANKESAITCEWAGCDGLKRQRWSFMTHLQDRHVNEANLKTAATKRLQQAPGAASPPPSAPPVLPTAVYPPNAALQAIRRFSARPPFPEMLDAKETPVTKHIHLTSALILRNLARYSSLGRSLIKRHEKHLAYIAFSETESSSAISNCLWELQGL